MPAIPPRILKNIVGLTILPGGGELKATGSADVDVAYVVNAAQCVCQGLNAFKIRPNISVEAFAGIKLEWEYRHFKKSFELGLKGSSAVSGTLAYIREADCQMDTCMSAEFSGIVIKFAIPFYDDELNGDGKERFSITALDPISFGGGDCP